MHFNKIKYKILLFFFVIGIIPFSISIIIEYNQSIITLEEKAQAQLKTVRELKKKELEGYFQHSHLEIGFFAQSTTVVEAIKMFKTTFEQYDGSKNLAVNQSKLTSYYKDIFLPRVINNKMALDLSTIIPKDSRQIALQSQYLINNNSKLSPSIYSAIHDKYHPVFSEFISSQGYYDLLLVDDATGDIVYTVKKETDFTTNLLNGPYAETNIGRLFKQIRFSGEKNKARMCDYERYLPSYFAPAAFIAAPIFDLNKKIGTLILQIPIEKIDAITTSKKEWREEGLGETGESFIIGKDCKMRTNSRSLIENPKHFFESIAASKIPNEEITLMKQYQTSILFQTTCHENVLKATNKQTGIKEIIDYRGKSVLSAYSPLNIPEVDWIFLAEIETEEAYAPVYKAIKRSLMILFFALAILIIAGFYLAKSIYEPILKLTNAAQQVTEGNLGVQVPIHHRKDEIGVLANTFNTMSTSFKEQKDEILTKNELLETQKKEITLQAENLIQLNKEITKINTHLDELVQNRTKVLEIQNVKLTEYAFLNSHKLRAPVATILGLVNVIQQSEKLEDKLKCIKHLEASTLQLDLVIKEIQEAINSTDLG